MSTRRCCCTTTQTGSDLQCLATETDVPPSQWGNAIYTLSISGSVPFKSCVHCPEPCSESFCPRDSCSDGIQSYAINVNLCCGDLAHNVCDGFEYAHITPSGGSNGMYGAYFEFNTVYTTDLDPNRPCTRFIPASNSNISLGYICSNGNDGYDTVMWATGYTGIRTCTQRINDCTIYPPGRDAACVDVCEIHLVFGGFFSHTFQEIIFCDPLNTYTRCREDLTVTAEAIYQRRKTHTDTHVAIGEYECVYSRIDPPGSSGCSHFGCGAGGSMGAVPSSITVQRKP